MSWLTTISAKELSHLMEVTWIDVIMTAQNDKRPLESVIFGKAQG